MKPMHRADRRAGCSSSDSRAKNAVFGVPTTRTAYFLTLLISRCVSRLTILARTCVLVICASTRSAGTKGRGQLIVKN